MMRGGSWYPYPSAPPYGDFVAGQRLVMLPPPMYGYGVHLPPPPPIPLPGMPPRPYEARPSWHVSSSGVGPPPATTHIVGPARPPEALVPPPKRIPPPDMLRIITFPHPADETKTLYNHFSVTMGSPELEHRAVELEQMLHVQASRIKADLEMRVETHKDAISLVLGGTTTKTSTTLCLMTLRCLAGARVYQMDFLRGRKKTAKNCAFFVRGREDYQNMVWYKHRIRMIGDAVYVALHKELAAATQALKDLEIPKSDTRSTGLELAGHPVDIMLANAGNKELRVERTSQDPRPNSAVERETDTAECLPRRSAELQQFTPSTGGQPASSEAPKTSTLFRSQPNSALRLGIAPISLAPEPRSSPPTAEFWVGIAESVLREGRAPRKDKAGSSQRDVDPLQYCRLAIELNPGSDYGLLWRVTRQALEFSHEPSLTITVNGNMQILTLKHCVVNALRADDGDPALWRSLSQLLEALENVTINGEQYSREACLARAHKLEVQLLSGEPNIAAALLTFIQESEGTDRLEWIRRAVFEYGLHGYRFSKLEGYKNLPLDAKSLLHQSIRDWFIRETGKDSTLCGASQAAECLWKLNDDLFELHLQVGSIIEGRRVNIGRQPPQPSQQTDDDPGGTGTAPPTRPLQQQRADGVNETKRPLSPPDGPSPMPPDTTRVLAIFGPRGSSPIQGSQNNCGFIAALHTIYHCHPSYVARLFSCSDRGTYSVRLFVRGRWRKVEIEPLSLPTVNGRLGYARCSDPTATWAPLLEWAMAHVLGGYEKLETLKVGDAYLMLTGNTSRCDDFEPHDGHAGPMVLVFESSPSIGLDLRPGLRHAMALLELDQANGTTTLDYYGEHRRYNTADVKSVASYAVKGKVR